MKQKISLLCISLLLTISCSRDNNSVEENITQSDQVKNVIINSYSKNYGYSGDEITITGENFPVKEKCNVLIGDIPVVVTNVSSDGKSLTFKLPQSTSSVPTLKFSFSNRSYTNNVQNNYNSNIAIINKTVGSWTTTSTSLSFSTDNAVLNTQIKKDGKIYYSVLKHIYSSLDDGITWKPWNENGFYGDFHATNNNEGWAGYDNKINKLPVGGGYPSIAYNIFTNPSGKEFSGAVYVENDMKNGVAVSADRGVYISNDGANFNQVVAPKSTKIDLQKPPFKLDINHIWSIGYDQTTEIGLIYYCNGNNKNWSEYSFSNYPKSMVNNIYFVDSSNGYSSIYTFDQNPVVKMFKTTNGGMTWNVVNDFPGMKRNISFVFIDANNGYASSDNKIYVTQNGGGTWTLDHTLATNVQKLGYANDCVYAFSEGKIERKFLK
ncbi:TPA: sialidase family protein [Elizabethkingia anophelis]